MMVNTVPAGWIFIKIWCHDFSADHGNRALHQIHAFYSPSDDKIFINENGKFVELNFVNDESLKSSVRRSYENFLINNPTYNRT